MILYNGKYLKIIHETNNKLFLQSWSKSPENIFKFKSEMLHYTSLYKKHTPKYSLWLQQNFNLDLDLDTQSWIEKNINEPCKSYGNEKLAFVVSQDILVHLGVVDTFDKTKSCIVPKHFASEEEARKWLLLEKISKRKDNKIDIIFEGVRKNGDITLRIKAHGTSEITNRIKIFSDIKEVQQIINKFRKKYDALTKREKEVLHWIGQGLKNKQIAPILNIAPDTVRTHRNNIWEKLEISTQKEAKKYTLAFPLPPQY